MLSNLFSALKCNFNENSLDDLYSKLSTLSAMFQSLESEIARLHDLVAKLEVASPSSLNSSTVDGSSLDVQPIEEQKS